MAKYKTKLSEKIYSDDTPKKDLKKTLLADLTCVYLFF